ncbi:hypothetical protein ABMA68_16400 [Halobacteriovorax sp. FRX-2]|uniref:hypothetical protein n=1 Tax=Halobacteriovorax sp. FRX-2 TaxID=3157711 RepID=UPI0037188BF6
MTTIALDYENRCLAADGRETDHNGYICSDHVEKIYEIGNGDVIAGAGPSAAIEYIVKHWDDRDLFDSNTDLLGLLLNSDSRHVAAFVYLKEFDAFYEYHVSVEDDDDMPNPVNVYMVELTYPYAIGSGAPFAIAAMDFGCSIVAAIEYAMKRDSSTGGYIRTWSPDVEQLEPVDAAVLPDHMG